MAKQNNPSKIRLFKFIKPHKAPIIEHDFALPVAVKVGHAGKVAVAVVIGSAWNFAPVLGNVCGVGEFHPAITAAIDHIGPATVGKDQQIGTSRAGPLELGCGIEDVEL